jgi:cellulose synthase/poly-beta-1,6-N-acetylglucosamine synthase-like glycosyltransferase/peptidoglycan/xylan/chitin deacetylase (PgdA/CDA1 family)/spore germination protein YaaH
MANKPIFFDASGRRAGRVSLIGWIVAVIGTIVTASLIASIVSIASSKSLPFGHLTAIHLPELERKAEAPGLLKSAEKLALEVRIRREELSNERKRRTERGLHELPAQLLPQSGRSLSIGFYSPSWSQDTLGALKRTLIHLDWVLPIWLPLQGPDLKLNAKFDPHLSDVADYIRRNKPDAAIMPVVQNVTLGKWDGPGLAKLLSDEKRRTALVSEIADFVIEQHFQGAVIDFEQMPKSGYGDLGIFLKQLTASLGPHGLIVAVAAPFDDESWPFAEYARLSDYTILMAYDQHDDSSDAGAITGQSWYEDTLDRRMRVLNPSRTIVALGSYGYDWNSGHADSITFSEAVTAAHDSEAQIDFDDATNNPHFSYNEDDGSKHDIWFLDGVTAYNEIHAADPYQPAGYALWRIGSEDPSIWSVMGRAYGALPPKALDAMNIGDEIDYEGQGEILRVEAEPSPGTRSVEVDPVTGDINDENYTRLPTSYEIRNFGVAPNKIALTFDDGPDPEWTPQILDILKEKHVKATFFIIGANAEANPGLVLRMYDEGHEIGDHTYTHPNLSDTPNEMVRIELTATQRLFEALTGHSMRLFRPPYLGDAEPTDADEIVPVQIAQDLGYTTVGEHVDPLDWTPGKSANEILKDALSQIHKPIDDYKGAVSVILLHDAGGDRSQTVAALPILIDKLRAQGYQFVPVSELVPNWSRDQVMPPIPTSVALVNDRVVFLVMNVVGHTLYYAFLVAIWLGIGRLFFLATMSLINRPREIDQAAPPPDSEPFPVSVIVPAYNEEKVIAKTIAGLLASTYRDLEILVVDDGSADNTSSVVREQFGADPRVTLIRVPNSGKASALNTGLARAQGQVVVALDADTQFNADTISRLVRWFEDPEIGAVAGNAKVGNRTNMVTRWQALEYVVAQNLERRALAGLGTLTVVPGAVGAWRREALVKLGGFRTDTLAEDQDLTIDIQRQGYRVHFDSSAIAWTEAPATFRGLAKQRFRWAYGTLQCLWKYAGLTFNPRYGALGMIALPQVWVFQILLTALAPLADLLLLWQLFWQWIAYLQHGAEFNNTDLVTVGIYYIVFVVVDVVAAIFGFLMEKGEDWSLLWWLPLQRFGYRQLMYYVVVRSISTAIRGPSVGWGKLERTGTVQVRRA